MLAFGSLKIYGSDGTPLKSHGGPLRYVSSTAWHTAHSMRSTPWHSTTRRTSATGGGVAPLAGFVAPLAGVAGSADAAAAACTQGRAKAQGIIICCCFQSQSQFELHSVAVCWQLPVTLQIKQDSKTFPLPVPPPAPLTQPLPKCTL